MRIQIRNIRFVFVFDNICIRIRIRNKMCDRIHPAAAALVPAVKYGPKWRHFLSWKCENREGRMHPACRVTFCRVYCWYIVGMRPPPRVVKKMRRQALTLFLTVFLISRGSEQAIKAFFNSLFN
jgi:hypothetical protein